MNAYTSVFSARFRTLLQYRAAAAAGFGCQMFWGLIRMMIFTAFYAEARVAPPMPLEAVVSYVWLGQAMLMLIPFRVDGEIEARIRDGGVAYELLRPVDLYFFWFSRTVANRTAPTLLRAVPMLALVTLAGWIRWPGPASLAATLAAVAGALLLAAALSTLMNVSMFWTLSGRGVTTAATPLIWMLSGMIVPLPLFPDWLQPVLRVLPFRGLCDTPFRLFTGHLPPSAVAGVVGQQVLWAGGLVLLGRWLIRRGLRRVVVQGG